MQKSRLATIHYPKRRHKRDSTKPFGIPEPHRKHMYDVVLENFEAAKRTTYLHRVIYVGEHFFERDDTIAEYVSNTVKQVHDSYSMEKLTGFFVYYRSHFIHMIEKMLTDFKIFSKGDEDSINKQIGLLLNDKLHTKLGTMKLLIQVSHIKQRLIPDWNFYCGKPSKLLGKIDPNCTYEEAARQIYMCIRKVYNLVLQFVSDNYETDDTEALMCDDSLESGEVEAINTRRRSDSLSRRPSSITSFRSIGSPFTGREPYRAYLPEVEMLEFILKNTFMDSLNFFYSSYGTVPQRDIYKDKVWPVPSDFIPYDVFSKPYDTITELPKPKDKSVSPLEAEVNEEHVEEEKPPAPTTM